MCALNKGICPTLVAGTKNVMGQKEELMVDMPMEALVCLLYVALTGAVWVVAVLLAAIAALVTKNKNKKEE